MFVKKPNNYFVARLSFYVRVVSRDMKKFSIVWREPLIAGGGFMRNTNESMDNLSKKKTLEALRDYRISKRFESCKTLAFEILEPEFTLKKNHVNGAWEGVNKDVRISITPTGVLRINDVPFSVRGKDIESQMQSCLQGFSPVVKGANELIKICERGTVGWQQ